MAEFQVRRGTRFKNASVQRHRGGRDSCGKWWCRLLAYCVLIYTRVRGSYSLRFGARKNISWVLCHRAKVEVKPCVHLFNRASLRKVSSFFFFGETFSFVDFSQGLFQADMCVVSILRGGRVPSWHATFSFVIVQFCGHVANVARRR